MTAKQQWRSGRGSDLVKFISQFLSAACSLPLPLLTSQKSMFYILKILSFQGAVDGHCYSYHNSNHGLTYTHCELLQFTVMLGLNFMFLFFFRGVNV